MAHRPSPLYQTGRFSFLLAKVAIKEQKNCLQNAPKHAKSNIDFNFFPGDDTPGSSFEGLGRVETVSRKDGGGRGVEEVKEREEEREVLGRDVAYDPGGIERRWFLSSFFVQKCIIPTTKMHDLTAFFSYNFKF
jgi:hypothetical protein